MKKSIIYLSILSILFFTSCSKDDDRDPILPEVSITNTSDIYSIAQEDTLYLSAAVKSPTETELTWYVDKQEVSKEKKYAFTKSKIGKYQITLQATNIDGEKIAQKEIDVFGKYRHGTFILNEGNMTTENGSLIFISPKGKITDSVYYKANGTELGNSTQDLFINNDKIYIIAQNGSTNPMGSSFSNDGTLVIANAETLKKEASYNTELSPLSWPTHIGVTDDDDIFIRDNNGVHLFHPSTSKLQLIKGTQGALKNRMAVIGEKIFAPAAQSILVMNAKKDTILHKIELEANVSGVIKSIDNNLWVSCTGTPNSILKIDTKDYSIIQTNEILDASVSAGWGASPGISAKGDTIYFSGANTKIYRHIFNSAQTEFMADVKEFVEDANIVYNNLSVNPKTGEVYFNSLKGYGMDYLKNHISIFNFEGESPKLSADYSDYTNFPAGIFFTYNFK